MRYIILLVLFVGCDTPRGTKSNSSLSYEERYINGMCYYKDKQTGLCYAVGDLGSQSATLSNVPCTPEVEALVAKCSTD